jgi:hypothetical protein
MEGNPVNGDLVSVNPRSRTERCNIGRTRFPEWGVPSWDPGLDRERAAL